MGDEPGDVAETIGGEVPEPERRGQPYLLVIVDGSAAKVPLPREGVVSIGRGDEVNLRVEHASVSRHHAKIFVQHGELRVADAGSRNGTRVNGVPVLGARVLLAGDVVKL